MTLETIKTFAVNHLYKGKPVKEDTQNNKISALTNIEKTLEKSIDDCTQQELWNTIENRTDIEMSRKKTIWFMISGYLQYYKLPNDLFKHNLKKDSLGNFVNLTEPVIEPVVEIKKKLPTLSELEPKIKEIIDPEHKFILMYLTSKDITRLDIANIKYQNYDINKDAYIEEQGVVKFPKLNKTQDSSSFKLSEELIELKNAIKSKDNEYLLNLAGETPKRRTANYGKLITRLSIKYFNIELNNIEFRQIMTTKSNKDVEHLPIKEQVKQLKEDALRRNHSVAVSREHYLQDTDDINVSIEVKKTLNIIHKGVTYSFDLIELLNSRLKL